MKSVSSGLYRNVKVYTSKESLAPGPVRVPPSVKEYYQLQKVSSLFFAFLWNKYLDISTDLYHDEIIQENKELSMLLI